LKSTAGFAGCEAFSADSDPSLFGNSWPVARLGFSSLFFDAALQSGVHGNATMGSSDGQELLDMASTSHQQTPSAADDNAAHANEHHTKTILDAPDAVEVMQNATKTIPVTALVAVPKAPLPAAQGTLHILVPGYKR